MIDLTGCRYGRLTVIGVVERPAYLYGGSTDVYLKCKCSCGGLKVVTRRNLTTKKVKSCGCLVRENIANQKKYLTDLMKRPEKCLDA